MLDTFADLYAPRNTIEEEVIKKTLDTVLTELEQDLIRNDSDYKLTNDQRKKWIDYAVTREFPPGMPWEDAEEKKKKKGTLSPRRGPAAPSTDHSSLTA